MEKQNSTDILKFLEIVGRLKHIERTGWVLRDVNEPRECIAGHMYRMALMTFLLDDRSGLDRNRCLQIALVHDLAEAIVGDLTPFCGVDPVEKHRREDEAMKEIVSLVGDQGQYIYDLFKEYETQSSDEAKFVKDIDRFDMVLQAFEYEKRANQPGTLQEFFDSTKDKFKHPMIQDLCTELDAQRVLYETTSQNGQN
ncbi:uncharacterized protein CBL_13367 [Carabus blaptoides fortunei]